MTADVVRDTIVSWQGLDDLPGGSVVRDDKGRVMQKSVRDHQWWAVGDDLPVDRISLRSTRFPMEVLSRG
jgi:hypothetical protein